MRYAVVLPMFSPCLVQAQTQALPLIWENGTTPVASMDTSGNVTTPGSVTTGYGLTPSGHMAASPGPASAPRIRP